MCEKQKSCKIKEKCRKVNNRNETEKVKNHAK